jgi:CRISPR/Cas system-associated exonuclease Cas4 (RecB family)
MVKPKRAMRAKLSIEAPGVRGALIFEGETPEVGKQLRQVVELLVPVGAGAAQPSAPAPTVAEVPTPTVAEVETPTVAEAGDVVFVDTQEESFAAKSAPTFLALSTLTLLFRCAHAFHLKLAGIKPQPSEDQKIGTDFHAGIAAFLRGEEYAFEYSQNEVRFGHIRELLSALREAPDLVVEPRDIENAGGVWWFAYANAIANGTTYEFKATKRLPKAPMDAHALQASVHAAMFEADKAKIVYITEKGAREFDVAPFAGVEEFLSDMANQIKAGVPNIPTGLTHPWGCDRCEYRPHCRFYDFVRGNGLAEIPF